LQPAACLAKTGVSLLLAGSDLLSGCKELSCFNTYSSNTGIASSAYSVLLLVTICCVSFHAASSFSCPPPLCTTTLICDKQRLFCRDSCFLRMLLGYKVHLEVSHSLRSMGLLGVARANTAVGVSPEPFLLLLLLLQPALCCCQLFCRLAVSNNSPGPVKLRHWSQFEFRTIVSLLEPTRRSNSRHDHPDQQGASSP
jgi:hypothetical protein